jgi:hypothetical protein
MKKITLFVSALVCLNGFSQEFHRCYTHQALLEQEAKNPGYLTHVNETFERAKLTGSQDREDVYTIPVVVHIVFNTPEENLPDSVIYNQIASLNADFRRLNLDAGNVRDTFNTIVGDTYINFVLASFDPDGNPTTGITRTNTDVESFLSLELSPAEGVKSAAEGGVDPWDQSRYLNIWVCDMSLFGTVFLLGYATPPDGLPHWPDGSVDGLADGVVIQYEAFGSNNPNPLIAGGGEIDVRGRTATHEVGHYLGLRHIWGDGDCTQEDGVDDTPNAVDQSNQDCDIEKNTCTDDIGDLGDLPDMVENYMDYSAETCQNSFTLGQVELMRGVILTERFDLIDNNPALSTESIATDELQFQLYPNPSQGSVTLVMNGETEINQVNLVAETGQVIQTLTPQNGQKTIEFTQLPKGVYFVQIANNETIRTEKLIIY